MFHRTRVAEGQSCLQIAAGGRGEGPNWQHVATSLGRLDLLTTSGGLELQTQSEAPFDGLRVLQSNTDFTPDEIAVRYMAL